MNRGMTQAHAAANVTAEALKSFTDSLRDDGGQLRVDKDAAASIAMLVRALDTAQERLRIHRGRPLPGSLRPTKRPAGDASNNSLV